MRSPQGLMRQAEQESERKRINYYDILLKIIIAEHQAIKDAAMQGGGSMTEESRRTYNEQKEEFTKSLQELVDGYSKEEQKKFYTGILTATMNNFIKEGEFSSNPEVFFRGSDWETIIKAPLGVYLSEEYSDVGMKKFFMAALDKVKPDEGKETQKNDKSNLVKFINDKFTMFKNTLLSGSVIKTTTEALSGSNSSSSQGGSYRDKFKMSKEATTISTPLDQPFTEQAKTEVLVPRLLAIQGQCEILVEGIIRANDPLEGIKLTAASTKLEQEQNKYLAILPKELHGQFNKIVKLQEEVIIQASGLSVNQATRETDIKNLSEAQQVLATEVNALKEGIDKIAKQESKTTTKQGKFAQAANRLSSTIEGWRH